MSVQWVELIQKCIDGKIFTCMCILFNIKVQAEFCFDVDVSWEHLMNNLIIIVCKWCRSGLIISIYYLFGCVYKYTVKLDVWIQYEIERMLKSGKGNIVEKNGLHLNQFTFFIWGRILSMHLEYRLLERFYLHSTGVLKLRKILSLIELWNQTLHYITL